MNLALVDDFELTGDGRQPQWQDVPWHQMTRVGNGALLYKTRCKAAWSSTGLYFLVDCEDKHLTSSLTEDYANLFTEDVVEIFLQPDPDVPLYLEYEISPLGYELSILVPNNGKHFHGWRPWNQVPEQRTRKATGVFGGPKKAGADVSSWSAEVFIPYRHFLGLRNCPPQAGTLWRGNIYRIDYDFGSTTHWALYTDTGTNFHDFLNFGNIKFLK
jgi:hypothetical protein